MLDLPVFKRLICDQIGNNELPEALQLLTNSLCEGTLSRNQTFLLRSRLSQLNGEIIDGQLSFDERKKAFAELSKSLLSLVDKLELADFSAKP